MRARLYPALAGLLLLTLATATFSVADEGMWTFDNPPLKQLKEKYGFTPTQAWLDHIRLSSVRFNDGGSGSFVSPNGLTITNHHVAFGQLQKLSTAGKDYVKDGFYARTQAEELKCPDLELNVLVSMENVTSQVQGAVKPGMTEKQALDARNGEKAKIQKESLDKTGLRSDVVTLYAGGEYWLYRYKKYTDVRLVFAPEQQTAFFGGDPDNFTFPRYDLDFALLRVYENGRPAATKDYLKWNTKGAADEELVFVSGNPGGTDRGQTVAQLETARDLIYPERLARFKRQVEALRAYSKKGTEQARQSADDIFGFENTIKAYTGEYNGLLDQKLFDKKQKAEAELRAKVQGDPEWRREYGNAWDAIAAATKKEGELSKLQTNRSISTASQMARFARQIVVYATEVKKPDAQRLEGYHDSQLDELKFYLFSPAPMYPEYEEALLAFSLQESLNQLGPNDPFIKAVLDGKKPADVAAQVIRGSKMNDPAFRKSLVEGGEAAVAASTDPLIVLARKVDPFFRETRKMYEESVESVFASAGEKIAKARFAIYGKSLYPDATFTLRLTYGKVQGYPMNGTKAPYKTTFYGLYDRAASFDYKPPFNLMPRFMQRKDRIDLSTPLDFVATLDIIGGNSGSPVINRNGEFVGIIFDGNIESLTGNFDYIEETNRAVAVHSAAVIEALRKVYDAGPLANELEGK
jgi:peptidase S46-like protein